MAANRAIWYLSILLLPTRMLPMVRLRRRRRSTIQKAMKAVGREESCGGRKSIDEDEDEDDDVVYNEI